MSEKKDVLGPTYEPRSKLQRGEPGKPEELYSWRKKLRNREEMLKYLQTGERYWFSKEWYGSEKRKTPA
jgi:hypothetical protein